MTTKITDNTRAAVITPPAPAGIAAIQIQGRNTLQIINTLFIQNHSTTFSPDRPALGHIIDPDTNETIDEVIVTINPDPPSAEIHCHGGPRIVQRILMLLKNQNVQIRPWQQLSRPASITEEIKHALPNALTPLAVTAIAAQHPAGLNHWLNEKINLLKNDPTQLKTIQSEIPNLLQTKSLADKLLNPANVVLTGPANAGKSTLANTLTGRSQSITADLPGTTRDWTCHLLDLKGLPVNLIDTAGRKPSSCLIEQQALEFADRQIQIADLILLVIESQPDLDRALQSALADLNLQHPPIILINKIDQHPQKIFNPDYIPISALTSQNLDLITTAVTTRLGFQHFNPLAPLIFTIRQFNLLTTAQNTSSPSQIITTLQTILHS